VVFLLADKNCYHSDIKPDNIVISIDESNKFVFKVIDFGTMAKDFSKTLGFTPQYSYFPFIKDGE